MPNRPLVGIILAAGKGTRMKSEMPKGLHEICGLPMMLSLMGSVASFWDGAASGVSQNLTLTEISKWLRDNVQNSSLRGIDFGIGIGALAMKVCLVRPRRRTRISAMDRRGVHTGVRIHKRFSIG